MQKNVNGTTMNNSSLVQIIKNKSQEKAIIGIIQDAIIWRRVSDKMFDIVNAFHPARNDGEHAEFEAENHMECYVNAFHVMDICDNDHLCGILADLFWKYTQDNGAKANELATTIYIEWLVCIKNHYVTIKISA